MMHSKTTTSGLEMEKILAKRSDLHLLRKIWHMGSGTLALSLYYNTDYSQRFWAIALLVVAVLGFSFDILRMKNEAINEVMLKFMGPFMRSSEQRGITGLPFYALGVSLSLFLYQPELAILSIFFLVFSDPISSFFGILFGKDKIMPNKSLQGAIAGFITCYLVTLFYALYFSKNTDQLLPFAIIAGIIGSLSELISAFNIDDNLTIPVVSGLGLTIINYFFPVF
jgi:diacylglycerol kinase (CTP)